MSAYNNAEALDEVHVGSWMTTLFVDLDEVIDLKLRHPQPFDPDVYQGLYTDPHGAIEEPYVDADPRARGARAVARSATTGPSRRWACPRTELPKWDDIQFVTAQLARLPLLDDVPVGTEVCIGPNADKPLWLDIPLFVSDM